MENFLRGLRKGSKKDDIPGTIEQTDDPCPLCGERLKIKKACCASDRREYICRICGWKSYLD